MTNRSLVTLLASVTALLCSVAVSAQTAKTPTSSQYVVSAKAGGVNFVEGSVSVKRLTGVTTRLVEGDQIDVGDKVMTGADGKAEILLSPGSYLRIGSDTTFDFGSTDLENLKVNLIAGSAVFEVLASDEFRVLVRSPKSSVVLDYSGVYRIDVLSDGLAKLSVFKGRANVGPRGNIEVSPGRTATLVKTGIAVSKFDRDSDDPLDIWSKSRAKEMTKLNAKLQRRTLRDTLLASYNQRGWGIGNSFGLWVFAPGYSRWVFMPFGYGWTSPYGWDYGFDMYQCRMPWYVWTTPNYPTTPGTTGGGGGGNQPDQAAIREQRSRDIHTPTLMRIPSNAVRSESTQVNNFPDNQKFPGGNSTPIIVAPQQQPAPQMSVPIVVPQASDTKRPGGR
jgi:hypothetical protein